MWRSSVTATLTRWAESMHTRPRIICRRPRLYYLVGLLFFAAVAVCAWVSWSNASRQCPLFGTWTWMTDNSMVFDFRANGTYRWRMPGDTWVGFARWHVDDSQLTITYSERGINLDFFLPQIGPQPHSESFPILSVSGESFVIATESGKRTFVRHEDLELANAP